MDYYCVCCGKCIRISKHKIKCDRFNRQMDSKTKQPKWCDESHEPNQKGIIIEDDGYVF